MFADRAAAGKRLAEALLAPGGLDLSSAGPPIVLGLPRGGLPVARAVADALAAPLDVLVVRKLGAPGHAEYAIGAIGPGGIRVIDQEAAAAVGATADSLADIERQEAAELVRRESRFRAGRAPLDLAGRTAIIVDDGVATGATAGVACRAARALGASRVILAVPVAPAAWVTRLGDAADAYVAVETPRHFWAVGQHYRDFRQTSDEEVLAALR
ncbi:MAG: phosphoribosyltransferase family protein [Pseudolysinimonas sp.]